MGRHTHRVKAILTQLTLKEKASLCSGADFWNTKGLARLGVPPLMMTDGPHGLRKQKGKGDHAGLNASVPATCFPTAAALACSWDVELVEQIGAALGLECLEQGVSVLLGPGANIKRSPLCGRNFEYYSEDPFLTGALAGAWIRGVQGCGVGASLKHFAANNQEHRRMTVDAVVDMRALREIYLAGFEAAIHQAEPWTVMCAYNRLNGDYCSENEWLLGEVLRREWGFEGIVVTDWGACNSRVRGLAAGQDLEMPASGGINDRKIVRAVQKGRLEEAILDRTAEKLLELAFRSGESARPGFHADMDAHHALARRAAAESAVLLKNEGGLLPLRRGGRIAVIGAFAVEPRYQGSGSSLINPARLERALDEIQYYAPDCAYAPGYAQGSAGPDEALILEACRAARAADAAVVFAGLPAEYESEGFDRDHLDMPESHNELIRRVAEANPNTVVVLMKGAPVEMPWIDAVKAVLDGYLGGQGGGGGLADVLFGAVNPCGKLAETLPLKLADALASRYFPMGPDTVEYLESLYVGYRWFDWAKMPVRFPFGHGLSYTDFEYANLAADRRSMRADESLSVCLDVKNIGAVAGAETVQLYVRDVCSTVFRPEKELKGFAKVRLDPGETRRVSFTLDRRIFAYYNTAMNGWHVESGEFELLIGASAADIRLRESVFVVTDAPEAPMPDLRESAPSYYCPEMAAGGIGTQEFEALCGRALPRHHAGVNKHMMTSTLGDVRGTWVGGMLYRAVAAGMRYIMGGATSELDKKMMDGMLRDMPLRNMVSMSGGWFPQWMMKLLLGLMNVGRD